MAIDIERPAFNQLINKYENMDMEKCVGIPRASAPLSLDLAWLCRVRPIVLYSTGTVGRTQVCPDGPGVMVCGVMGTHLKKKSVSFQTCNGKRF